MRIELPLGIDFDYKEDEKKAEVLLALIHKELSEPKYIKKFQVIIDEALTEVKRKL